MSLVPRCNFQPARYIDRMKSHFVKAAAVCAAVFVSLMVLILGMVLSAQLTGGLPTLEGNLLNGVVVMAAAFVGVSTFKWIKSQWLPESDARP